jgi:serine/threonine protein kinase
MPLAAGKKLGLCEILALVGKGGMGEVYRAHDDRLRRDVATKVSNAQFGGRLPHSPTRNNSARQLSPERPGSPGVAQYELVYGRTSAASALGNPHMDRINERGSVSLALPEAEQLYA